MSTELRTKEEPVKDRIKKVLRLRNVPFDMPATHGYGKSGNFDFVCCVEGAYLGIEAKRDDKEKPTRLQTEHAVAFAHGVTLLIHKDNVELVGKTIDEMRRRMRELPCRVSYLLSNWPKEEVLALLDTGDKDVKVIKGKKK
jgi:hypothetical protein